MQLKFGDRLDLSSYLLEPIQRLPRYEMFLDQLVKTYSNYEDEMKMSSMSGSCRNSIISWNGSTGSETTTSSEEIATTLDNLQSAKQFINKLLRRVNNTIALENIRDCQVSHHSYCIYTHTCQIKRNLFWNPNYANQINDKFQQAVK